MIYIEIRNSRSITAHCGYGTQRYGITPSNNHESEKGYYYSCNALPEQQFTQICEYCKGNKHRKYMNTQRAVPE